MKLRRNLLAGLANSVWSALVGLAVIPLYLRYLGIEAYGLIGFFVTTQALLSLLDLGLAPTINREVARCSAAGTMQEARRLLHTLAVVYWIVAVCIALLMFCLAPFVAGHWLQIRGIDREEARIAVALMGLVIGCRWPIGLYQGALMGMQRLTVTSGISMVFSTLSNVGAVVILAFVSPTLTAFFLWQSAMALVNVFAMRHAAWLVIGRDAAKNFDLPALKKIWRFSAGMSGVAITSLAFTQLDKVLLSRTLSLEQFGSYTLAGVAASGLYVLLTPVFNAIYPRMSSMVATNDGPELLRFYKVGTLRLCSALFPMVMFGVVFAEDLLRLWTGNPVLSNVVAPLFSLILAGTALNGVMHFPYALQLASGASRLPLTINAVLIVVMIPLTVALSLSFGSIGGAAAWFILNFLYVFVGTWMTHRKLLVSEGWRWLVHDVGLPLATTLCIVGIGLRVLHGLGSGAYISSGALIALLTILLNLTFLPNDARSAFRTRILLKFRPRTS